MASKASRLFFRKVDKLRLKNVPYEQRTPADYRAARRHMDNWHTEMFAKPTGVEYKRVQIKSVDAEWAIPPKAPANKAILYIHGGAWTEGSLVSHRHFAGALAKNTGIKAIAVGYRLAPENPYPAALEDCLAVYDDLLQQGIPSKRIIIGGESAGGNLTLATVLWLKDKHKPLPLAVFAISPATDFLATGNSFKTKTKDTLAGTLSPLIEIYAPGQNLKNPYISPLYGNYKNFPPLFIQAGSEEVLVSDSLMLAEKAGEAGVDITLRIWKGMEHAFAMALGNYPEADAGMLEIAAFLTKQFTRKH